VKNAGQVLVSNLISGLVFFLTVVSLSRTCLFLEDVTIIIIVLKHCLFVRRNFVVGSIGYWRQMGEKQLQLISVSI